MTGELLAQLRLIILRALENTACTLAAINRALSEDDES